MKKPADELICEKMVYLNSIMQSSPLAIAATDLNFVIKYYNAAAEKFFGYRSDEVVGRTVPHIHEKLKVDPSRFEKAIEIVRRENLYIYNVRVKTERGVRFLESRISGIWDEEGKLTGFVLMSSDVTDKVKAEEEVKSYALELERSNKELELFASIASHDLQEPLRSVSGFARLLQKRYKDKLDQSAGDFISFIVEGADRMQELIRDLLDYSRVTTWGKPFTTVDCNKAIIAALANLKLAIEESGAAVTFDPLPIVNADSAQLIRLFQNLIGNAIKYRGDSVPAIHVSAKREGDEWVISVADNGIGIDAQYYARIFQIFQRLHKRDKYPGTGIGLAVCKRIVDRHGGRIWVESEPGKGSVFQFTIPVTITAARESG